MSAQKESARHTPPVEVDAAPNSPLQKTIAATHKYSVMLQQKEVELSTWWEAVQEAYREVERCTEEMMGGPPPWRSTTTNGRAPR